MIPLQATGPYRTLEDAIRDTEAAAGPVVDVHLTSVVSDDATLCEAATYRLTVDLGRGDRGYRLVETYHCVSQSGALD